MAEEITGGKTLKDVNLELLKVNQNLEAPVQSVADKEAANLTSELKKVNKNLEDPVQSVADKEAANFTSELKKVNKNLEDPVQSVADKEAANEKARSDKDLKSIFQGIFDTLKGGFGAATLKDKKQGGLIAGLLGGIGSGLGSLGKGVANLGKGFAVGLAALGAGIAGFFLAIGSADFIAGALGITGENLKTLIQNFFGAFDTKAAVMMAGIVAAAVTIVKLDVDEKQFFKAMTALGAGISGFFAGILLGDLVATAGEVVSLTGANLSVLMKNFFGAFSVVGVAALTAFTGLGIVAAKFDVSEKGIIKGMTAIGAGLAGFFLGIIAADGFAAIGAGLGLTGENLKNLMKNFFDAFGQAGLVGTTLLLGIIAAGATVGGLGISAKKIVKGMTAVGAGMAGFFLGIIAADGFASIGAGLGGLTGESLKTLMGNFFEAFSQAGIEGTVALLGIIAAGATVGGLNVSASKIVKGMTAVGAGMAGFFLGIIAAEGFAKLAGAMDLNGQNLKTLINNFIMAFQGTDEKGLIVVGALLAAGATIGATLGAKKAASVAIGMTAVGGGLAGFFGGLMLADKFITIISDGDKIPGEGLSSMMKNFFGAFDGISDAALKAFGLLLVAGAAIGIALPGAGPAGVLLGMTALGAGLGGFFAGLALADFIIGKTGGTGEGLKTLMTNLGEGIGGFIGGIGKGMLDQLDDFEPDKLKALGEGIAGIGKGMLAFAGGQAAGAVGSVIGKIGSFFGADSPLDQISAFAKKQKDEDAERLVKLGKGIGGLGTGLFNLSKVNPEKLEGTLGALSKLNTLPSLANMELPTTEAGGLGTGLFNLSKVDSEKLEGTLGTLSKLDTLPSFANLDTKPFVAFPMMEFQEGGLVPKTGPAIVHKNEIVFDNQASAMMVKAASLLSGSTAMNSPMGNGDGQPIVINNNNNIERAASLLSGSATINSPMGNGGGQPIVINNNNIDNSSIMNSRQSVNVPLDVRSSESTKMALDMAYNG